MFNSIINFFYKITYYFSIPIDINIDVEDQNTYNLYENRLHNMTNITKYFIWRKYALILALPFLLSNIILSIFNFFNIKHNIEKYQKYNGTNQEFLDNYDLKNFRNQTQNFINLLNSGKTMDYILFYNVFSAICLFIEMILIIIVIRKNKIWYNSRKILNYTTYLSIFWIYFLYINPVIKYFKLDYNYNNSITEQNYLYSYSFTYVLYKLLKEIIPLSLCFFTASLWSISNVKSLFPQNIYIGYLYSYGTVMFFITSGTLLLVINQLMNNILFSICIGIFIIGLYLSNYIYGKRLRYYYKNYEEMEKYHFRLNFLKNCFFSIYLVVGILFIGMYDNPLRHGIYKFYMLDIAYFVTKFIYKYIFFKVWTSDILISWILDTEKYRDIYKVDLQTFNDKVKYIERQLYEDTYLSRGYMRIN